MKTPTKGEIYKARLKSTGFSMAEIANMLKMTSQGLNYHLRKDELSDDFKRLLKEVFPAQFSNWKSDESNFSTLKEPHVEYKTTPLRPITVPIYDVEFSAGVMRSLIESREDHFPIGFLGIPEVNGCDAIIKAKGDSMADRINDRDWIGIKRMDKNQWFPLGYIYAIETDQAQIIKYVKKGSEPGMIKIVSHNDFYEDEEIPIDIIKEIWSVKAILPFSRIETIM